MQAVKFARDFSIEKGNWLVATRKTPPKPGTAARGTAKATQTRKKKASPTASKAAKTSAAKADEPVILDPPAKPAAAKPARKPETIDAKAVEVKKTKPAETGPVSVKEPERPKATEPKSKPEPEEKSKGKSAASPPPPPPKEAKSRGGFAGFTGVVAGGVVAAVAGYLVAVNLNPDQPEFQAEFRALAAVFSERLTEMEDRISVLETGSESPDFKGLKDDLDNLKQALAAETKELAERLALTETQLSDALTGLESARNRLAENLSETGGEISQATNELIARYGVEIDALKAQLAEQLEASAGLTARIDEVSERATEQLAAARTKVEELSETAANAAKSVDLSVAAERLRAAVETGKSYTGLLAQITGAAAVEVPDALLKDSDNGVATLVELQQVYPEAARRALKASIRGEAGDGLGEKLTAFLKSQIGARSLEEKEGDDADAVLSQAEAALRRGELKRATELVRTLPPAGLVEMSNWLAAAEARLAVQAALDEFTETLDGQNQE